MRNITRTLTHWLGTSFFVIGLISPVWAAEFDLSARPLPHYSGEVHEGVSTCSSSQCHGTIREDNKTNVLRNEYIIWNREGRHAKAYEILLNDESKEIAQKMGLKEPAHEAKICLDCHADNMPKDKRGKEFLITDGVGCEACHGGSEKWLEGHDDDGRQHRDNLKDGMYPTHLPDKRAELCLSCHFGTGEKFATHEIMGAGHPRLRFEMDTFAADQPEHFVIDDDYLKRKSAPDGAKLWAMGTLVASRYIVERLKSPDFINSGIFPELALFDCQSCHHALTNERWRKGAATDNLGSGRVRLNTSYLAMARIVADQVSSSDGQALTRSISQLHAATTQGANRVAAVAGDIEKSLKAVQKKVADRGVSKDQIRNILKEVANRGANSEFRDLIDAEQALLSATRLIEFLGEGDKLRKEVDNLYKVIDGIKDKEDNYRASQASNAFAALAKRL